MLSKILWMHGLLSLSTIANATASGLLMGGFEHLSHPAYPAYGVRVKKVDGFCERTPGVQSYAGYVDNDARHLFFYFHESRNDPKNDPVLIWVNGGPGCSSTVGLFLEMGPCQFDDGTLPEPKHSPHSWTNNASVIFLEQPVGTGFSYADHEERVSTTVEAAEDLVAFVKIFFSSFLSGSLQRRPLHLTGESYGGRMLPVYGTAILDYNARLGQHEVPINLQSLVIVNGFTNYLTMSLTSHTMLCTNASPSVPPLLPISTCVRMKSVMPRCRSWYTESCIDQFDLISCQAAEQFCAQELASVAMQTGRNFYDLEEPCPVGKDCGLTKPWVVDYLNRADVRARLGIDKLAPKNITMEACSDRVMRDFTTAGDQLHSSNPYTETLLHRGIKVLHLVGATDWICNWVGNLQEAEKLQWSGQQIFQQQALEEWSVDGSGKRSGTFKTARSGGTELAVVTLDGTGHMAPTKKRREALHVLNKWITGQALV
ncbi:carboxypeptidase Y [Auriculariales sp. MPI-PUGE-AT-0066]|nr:carboxypeptidase Y [Auriculariales sp. MPI-PUGE-AT-0066]